MKKNLNNTQVPNTGEPQRTKNIEKIKHKKNPKKNTEKIKNNTHTKKIIQLIM